MVARRIVGCQAEYHRLASTLLHEPGPELLAAMLWPEAASFEASFDSQAAIREHRGYQQYLRRRPGVVVHLLGDLLARSPRLAPYAVGALTFSNLALSAPESQRNVLERSIVYTDEMLSYNQLPHMGYEHRRIHHTSKVYVMGDIHTNTIDGFWSLVKRGIGGVNHAVSGKYLQTYLNEYAFRYNRRDGEKPMFLAFLSQVVPSE